MSTLVQIAVSFLFNSFSGRVESERIKEVCDLFETWSKSINLVDDILNASDVDLAESLVNYLVRGQRNSLSIEFSESSFVDQSLDGLSAWESVCNVWLYSSDHVHSGLVVLYEDGMSDLEESEKRENLSFLRGDLGLTFDSNYEEVWALLLNKELVVLESLSLLLDELLGLLLEGL